MNRAGGGVLQLDDVCTKTGRSILEVLQGKHPKMREPDLDDPRLKIFEAYPTVPQAVPQAVPLDITAKTVEKVASHLSGRRSQQLATALRRGVTAAANRAGRTGKMDCERPSPMGGLPGPRVALSHSTRNRGHVPLASVKYTTDCSRDMTWRPAAAKPPLPAATLTSVPTSRRA